MKKVLFGLCALASLALISICARAQDNKSENKNEEIIINRKGGSNEKLTIEMNGKDVLINGKPISEFKDPGVTIRTFRNREGAGAMAFGGNNFVFTPAEGMNNFKLWSDSSFGEKRPFLGITTEKVDNGVKVTDVVEGSAAEKAGLKEGDMITAIGDKKINDPEDVVSAIHSYKAKDEVKIEYQRDGKTSVAKAKLEEGKGFMKSFSFNNGDSPFFNDSKTFMKSFPRTPNATYRMLLNGNHKLGVSIEDVDEGEGVKITNVEDGSAAGKAGLQKGDILTGIDGKRVKDVNDVRSKLVEVKDKTAYKVTVKRNGSDMSFDIKIPKPKNQADL